MSNACDRFVTGGTHASRTSAKVNAKAAPLLHACARQQQSARASGHPAGTYRAPLFVTRDDHIATMCTCSPPASQSSRGTACCYIASAADRRCSRRGAAGSRLAAQSATERDVSCCYSSRSCYASQARSQRRADDYTLACPLAPTGLPPTASWNSSCPRFDTVVVLRYGSIAMMLSDRASSLSCRPGRSLYACGIRGFTAASTWAPRQDRELCSTSFRPEQASLKQDHGQPDPPVPIQTLIRSH